LDRHRYQSRSEGTYQRCCRCYVLWRCLELARLQF